MAAQHGHQFAQFIGRQKGRGAAAKMQLGRAPVGAEVSRHQRHFFGQITQVLGGAAVVLGDNFVAATKVAERLAKRHMDVNRQGRVVASRRGALLQVREVSGLSKFSVKTVCRWVRGVTGAEFVKAADQCFREFNIGQSVHLMTCQ